MMYEDQSIIGREKIKQNKKRIKEVRESKSKTDEMISYVMPEYQKLLSENKRLKSDIDDLHNRSNSQQKTVKLMKIEEEQLAQGIQGATKEIQILKDKIDSKRKKITDFTDKKLKILDNIIMTKKRRGTLSIIYKKINF